jgi:hypothetical protein
MKLRLCSIHKKIIEVVLGLQKKLRLSSIYPKNKVVFHLRKIEVVFHISSGCVKIRLHTKNQLPRLPRIALIVISPGVVWCGVVVFSTDNNTTPTIVVLSCFGLLVGL